MGHHRSRGDRRQEGGGELHGAFLSTSSGYEALQQRRGHSAFESIPFDRVDMYAAEMQSFGDCILNNEAVTVNDGRNSIHILDIAEKVYASARTGMFLNVGEGCL